MIIDKNWWRLYTKNCKEFNKVSKEGVRAIQFDSCTIALIILAVTMVLFVWGRFPLPVIAVGSALAMGVFGVIPFSSAFSGFSNDINLMVIGSMVVGEALFETGVAQNLGSTIIKMVGTNERLFVITCVVLSAVLSAFLSNTAVVAMMLPIVSAVAASSKGAITKKHSYMAIGFAANVGGGMTLVGSSPNVVLQGLLADSGLETMSFFDLTLGSLPRLAFIILFYATIGYKLQKKVFDFEDAPDAGGGADGEGEEQGFSRRKMITSVVILILTITGFVSGIWTVGAVAMVAALACIVTGCISIQQVFARMDWTTVWVMAGSLGLAAGVSQSGAGELIANTIISLMGGQVSMFTLLLIFTILSVVLANIMSSTATSAMLGPIAFAMCQALGYSAKPVAMVIIWALNLAFLTPIATPPVTMTLQGGYRFLDYTKVGFPLMVGCLLLTIVTYPFLFGV